MRNSKKKRIIANQYINLIKTFRPSTGIDRYILQIDEWVNQTVTDVKQLIL